MTVHDWTSLTAVDEDECHQLPSCFAMKAHSNFDGLVDLRGNKPLEVGDTAWH